MTFHGRYQILPSMSEPNAGRAAGCQTPGPAGGRRPLRRVRSPATALVPLLGALLVTTAACERRPGTAEDSGAEVLIGMYGSLTGDGASFGRSSREGIELAVDEINAGSGVLGGRRFRLLVEDDQSRPDEAANAVTKLITQDNVVAVLGEVASRRTLAAAPVAQRYQIPMITPPPPTSA